MPQVAVLLISWRLQLIEVELVARTVVAAPRPDSRPFGCHTSGELYTSVVYTSGELYISIELCTWFQTIWLSLIESGTIRTWRLSCCGDHGFAPPDA